MRNNINQNIKAYNVITKMHFTMLGNGRHMQLKHVELFRSIPRRLAAV